MVVMAHSARWAPAHGPEDGDGGGSGDPPEEPGRKTDLQQHLQAMFALLPQDHVLKEVVRLESAYRNRVRYLAVAATISPSNDREEETCVLGFDCAPDRIQATLGLVLCLYADSGLTLDGDGGFSIVSGGTQHVFKPVSVHVLWAVLQSLHKACARAQKFNHYPGGTTHRWVESYRITSDRSCLNEWHYLPDVESRRRSSDPLMTSSSSPPDEKADRERLIRSTLKEVMMTLDLDVVTSKDIRKKVEEELQMDLADHKSFLDAEMLIILGQMDGASRIFDDVYLGSEWNASNLEELERNGIGHILNVTREIDNFFPDQFDYLNVRVYDDEATELLKHWDRTFKYIRAAIESGSKVLVHCKMGVSRSASVVIAYAMKAYHWDLPQTMRHVKERRACVKPNASFMQQLEMYAGILDASRQRHNSLWRSKSETNLVSTCNKVGQAAAQQQQSCGRRATGSNCITTATSTVIISTSVTMSSMEKTESRIIESPGSPVLLIHPPDEESSPLESGDCGGRPKSWSPDDSLAESLFPSPHQGADDDTSGHQETEANRTVSVSLRVPCSNGRTYSVSQNRAVQLESSPPPPPPPPPRPCFALEMDPAPSVLVECVNTALLPEEHHGSLLLNSLPRVGSVKDRICELEAAAATTTPQNWLSSTTSRTGLVLHLEPSDTTAFILDSGGPVVSAVKSAPSRHQAILVPSGSSRKRRERQPDQRYKSSDVFSAKVDRVFEREERRQSDGSIQRGSPHRQHSWGAGESRNIRPEHHPSSVPTPPVVIDPNGVNCWMPSCYSSDPLISSEAATVPVISEVAGRPGLVRMQRKALLEKADGSPPLNRSVSDSGNSSNNNNSAGSVRRLRRELEAKAAYPLTGSFAPGPLVVAALNSPPKSRPQLIRKRSLSLEKVNSPCSVFADPVQDWNQAAQDAADQVDLNVKLLVGLFETPMRLERPRGWSESSLSGTTRSKQSQRRSLACGGVGKPPTIPDGPKERKQPITTNNRHHPKLAQQQPVYGTM